VGGAGGGTVRSSASGATLFLAGAIDNAGNPLTFDANSGNVTASAVISGAGNVTKTGTGTVTFGTNTYTGATAINAGTLQINTIAAFNGTSAIQIGSASAATLWQSMGRSAQAARLQSM